MHRPLDSLNDTDLLVHWAAEEYVAAGRVADCESREIHRRRADFFAEAFRALRQPCAANLEQADTAEIGGVLQRAFGSPWRRR
jgi:hypothetical protein